ncbi:DNA cytosine methyltransferase [Rothia nasimurium]|uniref:DNA cytosine methyltransferase n=1 Tax=Rothia nasimurium TaxID=85336 RepID=UPI0009F449CA|nr:DNA cytosine methyltransferase [Rothia nasimurium]
MKSVKHKVSRGEQVSADSRATISAVDLFCGAGGLSWGLKEAGIEVVAGVDLDDACAYPFEQNIGAKFIKADIAKVTSDEFEDLWIPGSKRLLAGCAPCQPFSSHRRGQDTRNEKNWSLLNEFSRLIEEIKPDYVTMENVTGLAKQTVFKSFIKNLKNLGYFIDYNILYGPEFGLPQARRRLVLVGSLSSNISVPAGTFSADNFITVKDAIGDLPKIGHGESSKIDPLHIARKFTDTNLRRIQASVPGGTWLDWPEELRANCHKKASGLTFKSFYGRMSWDLPSPTITTQAYNYGTGRFGHPEQDRSITPREAAILQGFPRSYKFYNPEKRLSIEKVGRLIGNAVPPPFGKAVGKVFLETVNGHDKLKGE